jgi:hypothetical protein
MKTFKQVVGDLPKTDKSWQVDSGWKKDASKKNPRGVVTHLSDIARRKTAKLTDQK